MSKEFEEIVLKKLGNLETQVKGLNGFAKDTTQRLGNLKKELKETNQNLVDLTEQVKSNTQRLEKLELEGKDIREDVKYLRNNFTKFDFQINTKIDTLFDAYKVNKEKNDTLDDKMNSLEKETFNHDIRISNLEDKVLIA